MMEQPNVAPMSRTQPAEPTEAFASTFTAIVRGVTQRHGGDVRLDESPLGGLRVQLRLRAA